ncbi:MAG: hypothetical protein ABFD60_00240 [Bryobacteraceae bacterium]
METYTKPVALLSLDVDVALCVSLLNLDTDQFLSGTVADWTSLPKLTGVTIAKAANATHDSNKRGREGIQRAHPNVIAMILLSLFGY